MGSFFDYMARFHVFVGASESLFHCYIIHILYFNHLWSLKFCLDASVICGIVFSSSVVNCIVKCAAHTSSLKACRSPFEAPCALDEMCAWAILSVSGGLRAPWINLKGHCCRAPAYRELQTLSIIDINLL